MVEDEKNVPPLGGSGLTTRRSVVGALATGLVAATGTSALSQSQTAQTAAQGPMKPADYPKPPFPKQQHEWPGLTSKMSPRPDHGETTYRGSGRLLGRKALVTGGDSGIGRAAVIAYAREGADIAINYLAAEQSDADEVVKLVRDAGRKIVTIPGDLRDEAFCTRLVDEAARELGGLDILVNNAAYQRSAKSLEEITTEQFDQTFKTNIYAPFWLTKAALKHLGRGAAIINTVSVNSYDPSEDLVDYAATKGAIMIFSKGVAKQLAEKGIRVNAVAPGPVWTPLQPSGGQQPEKLITFGANTPMGRPGQPAELAAIFVLLASEEASFSTGQVFGASGGRGDP